MRLLKTLVFSNIYVAIPVTLFALETNLLFSYPINWTTTLYIYCSTLFLYSFHRYIGVSNISSDQLVTERLKWSKKHLTSVLSITIISGVLAVLFFFKLPFKPIYTLVPCSILAIGYSVPIWLKKGKLVRLRDINGIKIFLIAFVVAAVTTILPAQEDLTRELVVLFTSRVLFIIGITIPFDIRDINLDTDHQLKTIPNLIGIKKSKILSAILIIISLFTLLNIFPEAQEIVAIAISHLLAIAAVSMTNENRGELFYAIVIEGTMCVGFLTLLTLRIFN